MCVCTVRFSMHTKGTGGFGPR